MERGSRRDFVRSSVAAGAAVAAAGLAPNTALGRGSETKRIKIVGICCSPRKGKTTATSLGVSLQAAKQVSPRVDTELIELAGMEIDAAAAAGIPLEPGQEDDFEKLIPKLMDERVRGIVIGTPVYFSNMTSLCKAFLDRCITFYKNDLALSNKVAGVLAVGGARNGGQELTIQSVQAALFCHEMIIVGNGRPSARIGATVWNKADDDVTSDEFGMTTAKALGRRVAEVAVRLNP